MFKSIRYCVIVVLLVSCNSQTTADKAPIVTTPSFTKLNATPFFENDERMQKVEALKPLIAEIFTAHALEKKIPGIAYGIVVDDSLVIASSTGVIDIDSESPATLTSSFRIASMTKSFTAIAILKLRDEGKLSLEDPAERYLPEMTKLTYPTKDSPLISIRNLLTMTAGFPEDNPWGDRQLDETDQMLMALVTEGISFSNVPSTHFEYSNTGFALLGNVISRISGMPYQDYIRENILKPLGMHHTYWEYDNVPSEKLVLGYRWEDAEWKSEPMLHDGSYGAMGGLITSIEDFSKYVSFQLSAWPARDDEDNGPLKRSSLREMQTPLFSRLNRDAKDFNGDQCASISGYGYGLGITKNCKGIISVSHGGALPGFGSNYVFYPDYGVGIMAFGNLTYTGPLPSDKIQKLLFENAALNPRKLPVSDILIQRQKQVLDLIQTWDADVEKEIVAENLYLDESREKRIAHVEEIFKQAGTIKEVDDIEPWNQLRGIFNIHAENGVIKVYFTLNPEKNPKVQNLYLRFEPHPTQP